jgi:hypothetical protein
MKKIIIATLLFVLILLAVILIPGCTKAKVETASSESVNTSMFIEVEKTVVWDIVADRKTGVMYAVSRGGYNQGTFTLLVDAEGKPLIYKEKK